MLFRDRSDAGQRLSARLKHFAGRDDVIVLALPRGGVPVGYEVAKSLGVPLDVFVVRKLGLPGHEELAMGAIATGDVRVVNDKVIRMLCPTDSDFSRVEEKERRELERRERKYRNNRPPLDVRGKTVILVDDGIATGSTMRAAIVALRQLKPDHIVVAVPVGAAGTSIQFEDEADEVICVQEPDPFHGVGVWYDDFPQTTDDEVRNLLAHSSRANRVQ